jgi:hypothetical protein
MECRQETKVGRLFGALMAMAIAVSGAPRPQSNDLADHNDSLIVAQGNGGVCVVWVDDRRGALNTFARCSTDGAKANASIARGMSGSTACL